MAGRMADKRVGIRIQGVEAAVGLQLRPLQLHIMTSLQEIYGGESMNAIASRAVVHLHSRLAEQGFFGDDDDAVTAKDPKDCWRYLCEYAEKTSQSQIVKDALMSLWSMHTL